MQRRIAVVLGLTGLAAVSLGGCGGSSTAGNGDGGGGAIAALTVADKVSVVEAQSPTAAGKLVGRLLAGVTFDAATDYEKDTTSTYVQDRSTEAFGTVNEILCMVGQTRYEQMLNKGPYKAMVNSKLCSGNDSASNAGASQQAGTSGGEAPDYETWTVNATRASNSDPQIVTVWIHEKARQEGTWSEPEKVIEAKMVITKSAADVPPYGLFTINFAGYPATNGVKTGSTPMFKGVLKSEQDANGVVTLKFIDQEPDGGGKAVALQKNTTSSGQGIANLTEHFNNTATPISIKFAYNDSLFHRQNADGSNEVCMDRVNFDTSAWRYGMYDVAGARVNLASGFPINTKSDGSGQHGWVGFWGMWLPDGAQITNNTVYKMNYGQNAAAPTPYTVLKVGGKLKKFKKFGTTLGNIKNIPLEGYQETDPNTFQMKSFRVKWDGSSLMKVAYYVQTQNQNGPPAWTEMTPTAIDTTKLQWGELNFWSQALGGQVRVKLSGCTNTNGVTACTAPTADTQVAYFVENIVYPGDSVPSSFACYDNCPSIDGEGNVTGTMGGGQQQAATNYTFSSAATAMVLKNTQNVSLLQSGAGGQSWGYNSGPLFDPSPANMALLACPWDANQTCGWRAWSELSEFYTWETGLNNWNQLTVLTDGQGAPLKFEQPIKVEYTHDKAPYLGTKFYLDYNGFGELQGIPGKCVDMNDGSAVDCSQGNTKPVRWVPEFSIAKDSQVTFTKFNKDTGTSSSATGYIKPLEMEQRMSKRQNLGDCSALPIPANFTLPTIGEWTNPTLGTEPVVTAAPAVIGGVVQ